MKIAIIGASGVLGRQVLNKVSSLFDEKGVDVDLVAVASKKSVGRQVSAGDNCVLNLVALEAFLASGDKYDVLISALPRVVHEKWSEALEGMAEKLIDLSYASSLDPDVILVSDVERMSFSKDQKRYAVAHSVAYALEHLSKRIGDAVSSKMERIVATAMMAASENGKAAMDELYEQSKKAFVHQSFQVKNYEKQIAFNLLPRHGVLLSDRQNQQEWQIRSECSKLNKKAFSVGLTTVQAPVFIGTSLNVTLEFDDEVMAEDVVKALQDKPDFVVMDNRQFETFASPLDVAGASQILVSRVREDWSHDTALSLWMCIDNLEVRSQLATDIVEKIILSQ